MASIKLRGDTSGELVIEAPAVAGTNTLTLPASTSTLATTAQTEAIYNSLGVRNLIINGDMNIAQRGTSFTVTGGDTAYRTVDRWKHVLGAGNWVVSQDTDVPTGQGFAKSLKLDVTSAVTSPSAGLFTALQYSFEGQHLQHLKKGTANAESVTLSFWVKATKTGTYIVELDDDDNGRNINKSYTVNASDTWEKKTITFEGDTTGTLNNDNGLSLRIFMYLVMGTDYTSGTLQTSWGSTVSANRAVGQVNTADSASNNFYITGVQLEVGDTATPFEHRPYDMELARCQRYYQKSHPQGVTPGAATFGGNSPERVEQFWNSGNTQLAGQQFLLKVDMRANPSATIYDYANNIGKVTGLTGSGSATNNVTPNNIKAYHDKLTVYLYGVTYYGMSFAYTLSAEL